MREQNGDASVRERKREREWEEEEEKERERVCEQDGNNYLHPTCSTLSLHM